ncbi:MAG: YbaK/EbsC family protein [Candidatus Marinimicrobia bacterium]|jgi:Ala-tRNA(Pro) deacylase|nr:YbaK/EbsC family protein [Candidatus Neomarinimicrobiota bacterium]MDP6611442.1 YbaK/EbsC family protein [Candidatus Neomarinimicrobiota bacterium]|tara:strand:- start:12229 stop:12708 length:480 start_codon:yes stop_codon:yes gene_type:complete
MTATNIKDYLDTNHIHYTAISHSPAYTAQTIAATAHVSGKEFAKTVVVKLDGKLTMAVLPANYRIDFDRLKKVTGAKEATLATEQEWEECFPECEVGAMPPLGNLYDMDVFVTKSLSEDKEISFNAGTHTELIQMKYRDFENLVHPHIEHFSDRTKVGN